MTLRFLILAERNLFFLFSTSITWIVSQLFSDDDPIDWCHLNSKDRQRHTTGWDEEGRANINQWHIFEAYYFMSNLLCQGNFFECTENSSFLYITCSLNIGVDTKHIWLQGRIQESVRPCFRQSDVFGNRILHVQAHLIAPCTFCRRLRPFLIFLDPDLE